MNPEQVNTFLSLIYPSASSRIALCLIPAEGTAAEHRFTSVGRVWRFLSYARYRNAHGWGIYVTPSVLKPTADNRRKTSFQETQRVIYLDCDRGECLDHIRERYPYPTLVVKTSRARYQVYWRLEDPVPIAAQEQLMSALARDVHADCAATDVSRVLRLPSFWNRKPNRHNTVDIVFRRDTAVRYGSLWNGLRRSSLVASPALGPSTRRSVPCVLGELEGRGHACRGGLSESERDWYEVHRRLALGCPPAALIAWLEQKRADKRHPRYYAERTVGKALALRGGGGAGS